MWQVATVCPIESAAFGLCRSLCLQIEFIFSISLRRLPKYLLTMIVYYQSIACAHSIVISSILYDFSAQKNK